MSTNATPNTSMYRFFYDHQNHGLKNVIQQISIIYNPCQKVTVF